MAVAHDVEEVLLLIKDSDRLSAEHVAEVSHLICTPKLSLNDAEGAHLHHCTHAAEAFVHSRNCIWALSFSKYSLCAIHWMHHMALLTQVVMTALLHVPLCDAPEQALFRHTMHCDACSDCNAAEAVCQALFCILGQALPFLHCTQ